MNSSFSSRTIWGLLLITAGILFLLDRAGTIQVDLGYIISHFWPLIIIYIGLKGFIIQIRNGHGFGSIWNAVIALIGVYFLLRNFDVIERINFWQFLLPFFLIMFGLSMMFGKNSKKEKLSIEIDFGKDNSADKAEDRFDNGRDSAQAYTDEDVLFSDDDPLPPYDPEYTRKIEEDLDKAFQKINSNLKDDPFPLMSKPGADKSDNSSAASGAASNRSRSNPRDDQGSKYEGQRQPINRINFIGDTYLGKDYWDLEPTNVSHFIGDTTIDLTKANIPYGETKILVSGFIGDVKVFVPNDFQVEVSVTATVFIGDMKVQDRKESGMFQNLQHRTQNYYEADKRIRLVISMFIGDVSVKRVG